MLQSNTEPGFIRVNPFAVPKEQQGWRGIDLPGDRKRKWYTVVHNDYVLVTALVVLPGESGVRHSHETGELGVSFLGDNRPIVQWHAGGVLHSGLPSAEGRSGEQDPGINHADLLRATGNAELARLLDVLFEEQRRIKKALEELLRPQPSLHVGIDIIFPPFKTTIDDPAYPEKKTYVGQWYE